MAKENPLEVVLALGGGAARGLAHIGIIRVLEEHGVVVRGVAGTSIGAIVGGLYSADKLDTFETFVRKMDAKGMLRMLDPIIPRSGLLGGGRVMRKLEEFVGETQIEDTGLPFCAIATDLESGIEVVLRDGSLVDAIRASFAIPGVFTPVQVDGYWLVDGGVSTPVPIRAARSLFPGLPVIAVNLNNIDMVFEGEKEALEARRSNADPGADKEAGRIERLLRRMGSDKDRRPGLLSSISDSLTHMEHRISRFQIAAEDPDLLLEPAVFGVGVFDFHRAAPIIEAGEDCTHQAIESGEIEHLIAKAHRRPPRRD
ncbi:MAG: patatin-like phospholipase family protein [Planctomycetota bacterium]